MGILFTNILVFPLLFLPRPGWDGKLQTGILALVLNRFVYKSECKWFITIFNVIKLRLQPQIERFIRYCAKEIFLYFILLLCRYVFVTFGFYLGWNHVASGFSLRRGQKYDKNSFTTDLKTRSYARGTTTIT